LAARLAAVLAPAADPGVGDVSSAPSARLYAAGTADARSKRITADARSKRITADARSKSIHRLTTLDGLATKARYPGGRVA